MFVIPLVQIKDEFIVSRIYRMPIYQTFSYRTSHIEYLDILKTSDFFVFFRRKFRKPMNQSPQQQQQRQIFQKFAKNSENLPKICRKFLNKDKLA